MGGRCVIDFEPIQKQLFTNEEAMLYLGLTKRSTLDNLIRTGRITPIKIARENHFALSDLDTMVERELKKAKRLSDKHICIDARLKAWPRLYQSLRSSTENDWKALGVPGATYVVWMGHSSKVSREHYVRPLGAEFDLITKVA